MNEEQIFTRDALRKFRDCIEADGMRLTEANVQYIKLENGDMGYRVSNIKIASIKKSDISVHNKRT